MSCSVTHPENDPLTAPATQVAAATVHNAAGEASVRGYVEARVSANVQMTASKASYTCT